MTNNQAPQTRPRFGWGWVDGEDEEAGNRWIQIGTLAYNDDGSSYLDDEICVLMVRNFETAVSRFPGIVEAREKAAASIVAGLEENNQSEDTRVIVCVSGGCVQSVKADASLNVSVLDYDAGVEESLEEEYESLPYEVF